LTHSSRCATVIAVAFVFILPLSSLAQTTSHVRILDPGLNARFETGMKLSPTLRALVVQLDAAPVLLFVSCAPFLPGQIGARLNLITSVNAVRYVRVEINCTFGDRNQIALLAHELHHASEIAGRADILDEDSMESYFETYGFPSYYDGHHVSYETQAAIATQKRVMEETGKAPAEY
jgi:hypothetical protein